MSRDYHTCKTGSHKCALYHKKQFSLCKVVILLTGKKCHKDAHSAQHTKGRPMIDYSLYLKVLSEKLKETFGKDTFTEDELTKDFYTELKVCCGEFFQTNDGTFDMEAFWSEGFRDWLLKEK